jgi:hypothetical protein
MTGIFLPSLFHIYFRGKRDGFKTKFENELYLELFGTNKKLAIPGLAATWYTLKKL